MFSNFPVIVKMPGISNVFKPSCNFHQEVDIIGPDKHTLKLILYKYNRAYFLIRLYKKCLNNREHDWFKKFRVKLMNQITDSDHYDLHLSSEDFWMSDGIKLTFHCSVYQVISLWSIYRMTRTTQYIACDNVFLLVDHPDFHKWFKELMKIMQTKMLLYCCSYVHSYSYDSYLILMVVN